MPIPLRVLLIEDSDDDAELLLHELRRGGYVPEWQRVDTADALRAALTAQAWDLITCDYVMPQFSAPAALSLIRASGLDLPVIIVSGQVGEEVAVTAMKAGAHDYISKHRMTRLVPAIERELADAATRRARREAEATLRASEDKYRQLVDSLHEVVFEIDAEGRISYLSPAVEAVSGYTASELVGRPFTDFVHTDDVADTLAGLREAAAGVAGPGEVRIVDRAGQVRWVRTSSRAIFADGALVAVRGVLTDVTERKEAEDAYRAVFEHSLLGLAVAQNDRIVLANAALAALSGREIDTIIGQPVVALTLEMVHPDDRPRMLAAARHFAQGGAAPRGHDFRVVRPDGAVRRVLTTNTDFRYRGAPARLVAYMDVTDRWRAEANYRSIFENALQALVVAQGDRYLMVNPAFCAIFGVEADELLRSTLPEIHARFIHPEDQPYVERVSADWIERGEVGPPFEYRLVRPDGAIRHISCRSVGVDFDGGPAVLVAVSDLSDQRRAEQIYRAVFEHSPEALAVVQDGRLVVVNPAHEQLHGVAADELMALGAEAVCRRFVHPDDQPRSLAHLAAWGRDGALPDPYELRVVRPDGELRWVRFQATPIEFDDRPAVLLAMTDLTERRRAEEAYQAIFDHSVQGLMLTQDDRIVMANPAVSEISGYTREELLATPLRALAERFVHPDQQNEILPLVETWVATGRGPDQQAFRVRRHDGTDGAFSVQASRLMYQGRPALLLAFTDLTDRWRAEEAHRSVFEHSLQGLTVVCEDHIVMANQAIVDLTGYSFEELVGSHAHVLMDRMVHPDDRAELFASLQDHRARGTVGRERRDFRLVHKDGSVRHVSAQSSPISFGGKLAMLVAHVDLSDRWQAEEALRALNADLEARVAARTAELERTARELETFSYSVSHDLRAPLRAIDGYTQAVLADHGEALPATARADLERVRAATRRMAELIDQLLGLARVMRGELRRGPVDLSQLAREVAQEIAGGEPARTVAISIAEGLRAQGDAALVRAVLSNLLANAWKFTRTQRAARVEVGAVADTPGAFFVRDNGVGFDMGDASRLFQAFQRLHPSSEFDGNGIGLATVARIVDRHGGRVWAEAAAGAGATFFFTLG
ncbi:MAG: PAS domain S-box protein [Deltaproteobacteria bacterium]|nr:PAS domain S-box protein [Deltaproteobacteria bacterium]